MNNQTTRVIVIGAGYAGLLAAVRLAMKTRQLGVQISLINRSAYFMERPRLHQFAANQVLKSRPIGEALTGSGVNFLMAEVQAINVREQQVTVMTSIGSRHLEYDYLLYTAGSMIGLDSVPGARQFAYSLNPAGERSATELKTELPELERNRGRLLVVGGGPTGIEAAAEFAEAYPGLHVTLVTGGELASQFGGKIQVHIRKTLERLGVSIRDHLQVTRVEADKLITRQGTSIPYDLCLWAGGFVAPSLATDTGLLVNDRGQVVVDSFMRSLSNFHIYAAGDSAQPVTSSGIPVRMAAYTAAITGAHAADCLANAIQHKPAKPLNFAYLGQGIALGRHDTVDFNNYPDDQPKNPIFTGLAGVVGRELFVNLLADLPRFERRFPGFHFWPSTGRFTPSLKVHKNETPGNRVVGEH